jgi:hypothetical protein
VPEDTTIRAFVLSRLELAVRIEIQRLERANVDSDLPQVSWRARNLLELMVWTFHCAKSEQSSKTFCEDSSRDGVDAMKTPTGFTFSQQMSSLRQQILDLTAQMGIDGIEEDYTRVAKVAQELGLGDTWRFANKGLSKLAHPTAFAVIYPLTGENESSTRMSYFQLGRALGESALTIITEVLKDS